MQPQNQHITVIGNLEDLFSACYTIIDDLYRQLAPKEVTARPGPEPSLSDAEVITISVVGELFGMDVEARWYSLVSQQFRHLFPGLNERSRFNRRRRDLWWVSNLLRHSLVEALENPSDPWRIIDSFPLVVAGWGRRSRGRVARAEGGFGIAHAKGLRFFGFRVHVLITLDGVITNFVLAPANAHDATVAPEVLEGASQVAVLGDKAYGNNLLAEELARRNSRLVALRRKGWPNPPPEDLAKLIRSVRQLVETVGSQLAQVFHLERNLAKGTWGIRTRIIGKLLAHTIGCFINRLMGRPSLHMASFIY